jgi:tryptophan synthase alpha chain
MKVGGPTHRRSLLERTMSRYEQLFERLDAVKRGALVPFVMLGDPDLAGCWDIVAALVEAGADALELGIPFSDPVADGPVIQAAAARALASGVTPEDCFRLLKQIRDRYPELPIGVLTYGNLVAQGDSERFYAGLANAGVDSILLADIPGVELRPFIDLAQRFGLAPILVVPPNATASCIERVAQWGKGYTYVLGRAGVTGTHSAMQRPANDLIRSLKQAGAPPALLGFGISTPAHVRSAIESGARGAIVGSAVVAIIATFLQDAVARAAALREFMASLAGGLMLGRGDD